MPLSDTGIQQLVASYGYLAIFLLVAGESLGIPLPGELTLLAGATYAATGRLHIEWVIGVAIVGTVVGGNLGYAIGRVAGHPLLLRYGRYVLLDERRRDRLEAFFEQHGDETIFLSRFVTVLRTFAAILAGANEMPVRKFLIYNAAGGVVWATLYGILAYELGRKLIENFTRIVGVGGAIVVIAAIAALVLRRRAHRWLHRAERKEPTGTEGG